MSLPTQQIPESSEGDDIDLRELGATLNRHRHWVVAFILLGAALGGFVAITQKPISKICLFVNITDGPSIRRLQNADLQNLAGDKGLSSNSSIWTTAPVQPNLDEVIYSLQTTLNRFGSDKPSKTVSVEPLKIGNALSQSQVAACGLAGSDFEARQMRNLLVSLESTYRQDVLDRYKRFTYGEPASKFWTQVLKEPTPGDPGKGRFLALGGMGGFVAGCIAALIADRRLNRVYGLGQILGSIGYPFVAKLPPWPWDSPGAQSEIAQLAMQMDPGLSWLILSIGREHPVIGRLVDALQGFVCGLDLQHMPPLFVAPVMPPDPLRPVGVLVVVERGFNSLVALQESRRVLASLSFVKEVGVVLIGEPLPPELRL